MAPATAHDADIASQTLERVRAEFKRWLATLPSEVASDLQDLFAMHAEADSEQCRAEIADTIFELLNPSSLDVVVEEEFELDHENPKVRARLQEYRKRVGKEIKRCRNASKLTQEELATKAGIPQSHVSRLERGVHVPTHQTVERIAKALGVCPPKLDPGFEGDD